MEIDWKQELSYCVRDAQELARYIPLKDSEQQVLSKIIDKYPMAITPYYLSLIDPKDANDPIRRMCIPTLDESMFGGSDDTSGESSNTVLAGLQHKYRQTALILSTNQCAMYCRHCFRKRMVGTETDETIDDIGDIVKYLQDHEEINNVLISGGDAFLNSNKTIASYLEAFSKIEHLDFIRFGTRTPVVLPQRITKDGGLLRMLQAYGMRKQLYVITQFNHPRELTPQAILAIDLLREAGIVIKNQTVLLRGINDDPIVLGELLKQLSRHGVVPYYIFQCRPVTGVKNQFQVPFIQGCDIVRQAKGLQNGQGKCIRYCMSHPRGKIEILGMLDGQLLCRFHQAKDASEIGRIFTVPVSESQAWLDDRLS